MQSENHITWWNAFKQGDWTAYTALYEAFYAPLNNYGVKFTDDADLVQDAIHDLFVQLWTSRNNLSVPASVKNYLYKSLRTLLFRKIQSQAKVVDIDGVAASERFTVTFKQELTLNIEAQELRQQVAALIEKLPARQQEIIFLRFFEGATYDEIADIMGISTNSAYKLLYKALENLQRILNKRALALLYCILLQSEIFFKFFQEWEG
ncbi:sigma-70 family RNA polymerase sigma factor [Chitinophaga agrisoli]|uniref:Sigma-70 family RNA polymerase sigma factor n=1 Tax=Chitinophaga agrisoli TaxID=2607653 RepID=A0A5B2W3Z8_9BACT|nr:sigma-70 family RNA polymerase sigma factor [Chitinophaga agrisoli]KAA2245412.1 sigma-70 family RNA polymerase sigma factor [Chitinophaga agrisoli]